MSPTTADRIVIGLTLLNWALILGAITFVLTY